MAPFLLRLSLPDPPLPFVMIFHTVALFGSGGLWEALVGQEGVWGGFGEALGGFGEALGRLWEALGRLWEALGRLWGGFGRLWGGFGKALGGVPPSDRSI